MNCGKCKSEFGSGNFCITCGASSDQASEETKLASEKRSLKSTASDFANRLLSTGRTFVKRLALTTEIVVVEPLISFVKFARRNKRRSAVVGSLTFLFFSWLTVQLLLSSQIGPEQTAARYVEAIKTGNFDALADESLFPGATVTPKFVQSAWVAEKVSNTSYSTLSKKDGKAEVRITNGADSYSIQLASSPEQYFVFSIPEWSVTNKAPVSKIVLDSKIDGKQVVSFSTTENATFLASTLRSDGQSFNALPGYYESSVEGLGFNKTTRSESNLFAITDRPIRIEADAVQLASTIFASAKSKARSSAVACAKSKCSASGRYKATDFNLWSKFFLTGYNYTSSRFSYKLTTPTCGTPVLRTSSAFRGTLNVSCSGTVKGHLYVRYTYYKGYFSDYYYYWNFYDDDTYSISISMNVSINDAGKVTLGSARRG